MKRRGKESPGTLATDTGRAGNLMKKRFAEWKQDHERARQRNEPETASPEKGNAPAQATKAPVAQTLPRRVPSWER
jgi:hypothetical protein